VNVQTARIFDFNSTVTRSSFIAAFDRMIPGP